MEVIHGLLDQDLGGVVLLRGALLIGGVAAVPLRRIFHVRRGIALVGPLLAAKAAVLVVGDAIWCSSVPAQGRFACMREARQNPIFFG